MNIIREIKALFVVNKAVNEIIKGANQMNGSRPGWKTTEFYLSLASQVAVLWGAVQGFIPPKWAAIISVAGTTVYTVARTILKAVSDVQSAKADQPSSPVTVSTGSTTTVVSAQ